MLWFNIFKGDAKALPLFVNSYYADLPASNSREMESSCKHVLELDLAFSGNTSTAMLVAVMNAQQGDKWTRNANYVYAPWNVNAQGKRPIGTPLEWPWCLNVRQSGKGVQRAIMHYHGAVSKEELDWEPRGRAVLKIPDGFPDVWNDRKGFLGGTYRDWLYYGTGSAEPGNPLDFVRVEHMEITGVSVHDKARRSLAREFQSGHDWLSATIGACIGASYAYSEQWEDRGLEKPDFIGIQARDTTLAIMGITKAVAKTWEENQKNQDGDTINKGEGWRVRFGATGATLKEAYSFLDQKYDDDIKYLQKFQPVTDVSGEKYFHLDDAKEWWEAADDWYGYLGQFCFFDFRCSNQDDLKDMTRLDNYTPLYPDLPSKVDNVPRPQKNPKRLREPFGLFL